MSVRGTTKKLSANMGNATVTITFSAASDAIIANKLSGLPITPAQFKSFAAQAFSDFIHGLGEQPFPLEFTVVPGVNGSLSPLQLEKMDIHCITNSDRNKQALCIMGILLAANDSHGTPNQKTATAITGVMTYA